MAKHVFIRRAALSGAAFALLSFGISTSAQVVGLKRGPREAAPELQKEPETRPPTQIVAEAPASEWVSIAPSDLLVMQLAPDASQKNRGARERRVVIQLMPAPFSQMWVGNIRTLAAAQFWDGLSIYRVQDNYVTQWGDADGEDATKAKALPDGLWHVAEDGYVAPHKATKSGQLGTAALEYKMIWAGMDDGLRPRPRLDEYAEYTTFIGGWPVASEGLAVWPVHCYGMVGVARDLSPNTGTGAELYVVIGHAPRHLDRNIALVGRVIEGMEHMSSLPRGTGALGFYENADERTPILSVRMGDATPDLPAYEYLNTAGDSFAAYANARANRQDAFFIRPAGGADICNIPVPVRRKPA